MVLEFARYPLQFSSVQHTPDEGVVVSSRRYWVGLRRYTEGAQQHVAGHTILQSSLHGGARCYGWPLGLPKSLGLVVALEFGRMGWSCKDISGQCITEFHGWLVTDYLGEGICRRGVVILIAAFRETWVVCCEEG